MLLLGGALLAGCGPKERTVELPPFEGNNSHVIEITQVDLTDSLTTVSLKARFIPHYWIKMAGDSRLQADGKQYKVVKTEGIELDSLFWMPESGEAEFQLMFEPLPVSTKQMDFIEGDQGGAFRIWGIDISGKPQAQYPEGLPRELRNQPLAAEIPEPEMKNATTTARIHYLGNVEKVNGDVSLIIDDIMMGQQEIPLTFDANGVAEAQWLQHGPVEARVYATTTGRAATPVWIDAGEDIDIYVDGRFAGDGQRELWHPELGGQAKQYAYSTGKYAALTATAAAAPKLFGFGVENNVVNYRMSGDEFTQALANAYKSFSDSIEAQPWPEEAKAMSKILLKEGLLDRFCVLQYLQYRVRPDGEWEKLPKDSVRVVREPRHYQEMAQLLGIDDLRFMLLSPSNYASAATVDWAAQGVQSPLMAGVRALVSNSTDAENGKLTDAFIDSIGQANGQFYGEALHQINDEGRQRMAEVGSLITPTPNVAPDKVFDAIIASYKGKKVIVDLWNTWCGPCRAAIAANEPMKDTELKDADVVYVYIANETSPIAKYVEMIPNIRGVHYRVGPEAWSAIAQRFAIDGIPSYILVDRQGRPQLRNDLRDHSLYLSTLKE